MRGSDLKLWLARENLAGTRDKRYVDIGALWADGQPGFGETISIASEYTRDLTIIDPAMGWWPPVRDKFDVRGIACDYLPIDVLDYTGAPFHVAQCCGLIYHLEEPDLLWRKLSTIVQERLVIHTVAVPHWIMPSGRTRLVDAPGPLRRNVERYWDRYLTPHWIRPESETSKQLPYAAMHSVYSAKQLKEEARAYGWRIMLDIVWRDELNVGLLLERD